ncbi:MAG: TIM44-like domain-containing protein [Rickettsiaceae bacterium]
MPFSQIIELVFFAIVAFLVIGKLISILGVTSDDDPSKGSSYFGESSSNIRDVTNSANHSSTANNNKKQLAESSVLDNFIKKYLNRSNRNNANTENLKESLDLNKFIVSANHHNISKGIDLLQKRLNNFTADGFISSAKMVLKMIVENKGDESVINQLVDKRYIDNLKAHQDQYNNIISEQSNLEAKIFEIYMFGNNAFITVVFTGLNIIKNQSQFKESWVFNKNLNTSEPNWYLSNIEFTAQ